MRDRREKAALRIVLSCTFFIYLLTMIWYTIVSRRVGYYPGQFDLFWSYKLWFDGNRATGHAILANIAMFVPFGFLLSAKLRSGLWKTLLLVFLVSLAATVSIELMQYTLMRGIFEFDDIWNNAAGAILGAVLFCVILRFLPERAGKGMQYAACFSIVLFCLIVLLHSDKGENGTVSPISQGLCFQVDEASVEDDRLQITGVCFWYEHGPADFTVVLKSVKNGECRRLETNCGISRADTAAYFKRDDLKAGFDAAAQGIQTGEEYEIMLDYGLLRRVSTGIYLTIRPDTERVDIHYVSDAVFRPLDCRGTDLERIVEDGVLRVYNPEHHIYVYWYDGKLVWIAEDGFRFEKDESTRMELLLWTTETEKLSERSRESGRLYDTFGVYFEKYELQGNFGRYRVCARELPADYIITSIKTGYYAHGWVWQRSFWPVFDFSDLSGR